MTFRNAIPMTSADGTFHGPRGEWHVGAVLIAKRGVPNGTLLNIERCRGDDRLLVH